MNGTEWIVVIELFMIMLGVSLLVGFIVFGGRR